MSDRSDSKIRLVDLSKIYNKNEKRVVLAMEKILGKMEDWEPEPLDIQDIYALSLNRLQPRYVQEGTIVFNEPIRIADVESVVQDAINQVKDSPNY